MSGFGFLHAGQGNEATEELYEYYANEDGDQDDQEGNLGHFDQDGAEHGQEYDEATYGEDPHPEQEEEYTNEYDEHVDYQETADASHEEHVYGDGDYHEHGPEDQYYEDPNDEAAQLLDEHGEYADAQHEDVVHHDFQESETEDPEAALKASTQEEAASATNDAQVEEQAASTASSATVQGDLGYVNIGEYEEDDFIDWDDDEDYLTSESSDQQVDGEEDDSTLLTQPEDTTSNGEQIAKDTAAHAQNKNVDTFEDTIDFDEPDADENHVEEPLASEDFLVDFEEQTNNEATAVADDTLAAAAVSNDDNVEQYVEQPSLDGEPDQGDEQDETGEDLLDGDAPQQAPAQSAPAQPAPVQSAPAQSAPAQTTRNPPLPRMKKTSSTSRRTKRKRHHPKARHAHPPASALATRT